MKKVSLPRKTLYLCASAILACAAVVVFGSWRVGSSASQKDQYLTDIRNGIGREVKFSKKNDSRENVRTSVKSATAFIYERSGIRFSENAEERLTELDSNIQSGVRRHISQEELTDALTNTAIERVSDLTDGQIDYASKSFRLLTNSEMTLRANGKGAMTEEEFASRVRAMREESGHPDPTFHTAIKAVIADEVSKRVKTLEEALPEHFGGADDEGLTATQAILITYSVASDDPMQHSTHDLRDITYEENKALRGNGYKRGHMSEKPYGPRGSRFSTPLHLLFNERTMGRFMDHLEGRDAQ